ncbi:Complement inhibitory receptor [Paragonimus heterotremus]|uniref:Complement inhibitory receptor n=1 Tax=Paragonimus heterotremus TaxID=100268 RepID=A0A8J4TKX5_9TREM|nr:Complement inhibitory receptor [Paragonimus heterotremus]
MRMVRLSDQQNRFTCCFCLHVRTGTILLGVGQIILHLICISVLILLALRPDLSPAAGYSIDKDHNFAITNAERNSGGAQILSVILHLVPGISDLQESMVLPSVRRPDKPNADGSVAGSDKAIKDDRNPENENDPPISDNSRQTGFVLRLDDPNLTVKHRRHFSPYFALCLSTFSLAFCCFLVHGALARQPTHLLPFFFLQVFDFIISLLTVVGYMSSTSEDRLWLHTKNGPMVINSATLTFLLLSILCLVLAFKGYCLGMVWDCYKYLMLTYQRGDRGEDWSTERFGFLPTIWSFLGTGRSRPLIRTNGNAAVRRMFGSSGEGESQRPAPPVYDQSNDLPNYEDVLKVPANAYAPPPYFCPSDTGKPTAAAKTDSEIDPTANSTTTTNNNSGDGSAHGNRS